MKVSDFKNQSKHLIKSIKFLNKNRKTISLVKRIYGPYFIWYLRDFISFPKTFSLLTVDELNGLERRL